jgi:hypothetical protein
MGKKRGRAGRSDRATRDKLTIRRSRRNHFLIISLLTVLASLALVIAGFLSYSTPAPVTAPTPTIAIPMAPQGGLQPPLA